MLASETHAPEDEGASGAPGLAEEAVHLSSNREPARLAMDPDSNQTGLRHSEHSA